MHRRAHNEPIVAAGGAAAAPRARRVTNRAQLDALWLDEPVGWGTAVYPQTLRHLRIVVNGLHDCVPQRSRAC